MSEAGCNCRIVHEDFDRCYRAVQSKDARFDGWFVTAVRTTGIYCRPSCPVRPPFARNMRFYPTAAAAQRAGYRACKRCRPDASPGSPEWNIRDDLVGQGHEADRRRHGGPRRRRRSGRPPRLHHPAASTTPARGNRRRPARTRPRAAHPDRADTHRDHGSSRSATSLLQQAFPAFASSTTRCVWSATARRPNCADARSPEAVATQRSCARPGQCPCACRCGSRSPTRECSATWPPASCPAAKRCATAPTGARCGCRSATEPPA